MNLINLSISWAQLRSLNELYVKGRTRANLLSNSYIKRLKTDKKLLRFKVGNLQIIEAEPRYREFYEANFLEAFDRYTSFFAETGVESDGKRSYSMYDLETLIYINQQKSILQSSLTTERSFSAQIFKGSKYLERNQSVLKAVLKILEIEKFPYSDPKEQKWRLIVDCPEPRAVILCENLSMLKQADIVRSFNIEAWYVGGNNIKILEFLSTHHLQLPIYYLCDWDEAGLLIFSRVKNVLVGKATIKILRPHDLTMSQPVDSPHHHSRWRSHLVFSGLTKEHFEEDDVSLIEQLIRSNKWIEEESQDFGSLLKYNNVI